MKKNFRLIFFLIKILIFFVFKDIKMKLDTFMYYGFLINIDRNNFFPKVNIFDFIDAFMKKSLDFIIFLLNQIYFKNFYQIDIK